LTNDTSYSTVKFCDEQPTEDGCETCIHFYECQTMFQVKKYCESFEPDPKWMSHSRKDESSQPSVVEEE